MKYNISKELFEAVSEHKVDSIEVKDGFIIVHKGTARIRVSIYEFFFKCKEWIEAQYCGYVVLVDYTVYLMKSMFNEGGDNYDEKFTSETIQQALFDACEYIRKELL